LFAVGTFTKAVARISGANFLQMVWDVALPIARRGIGAEIALSFVHTIWGNPASCSGFVKVILGSPALLLLDFTTKSKTKLLRRTFDCAPLLLLSVLFSIDTLQRRTPGEAS
jgi:ABC-type Fe3+ transport system permease subunit